MKGAGADGIRQTLGAVFPKNNITSCNPDLNRGKIWMSFLQSSIPGTEDGNGLVELISPRLVMSLGDGEGILAHKKRRSLLTAHMPPHWGYRI